MTKKLYKLDSKNKVRVWLAEAVGDKIVVTHGLDDGQLIVDTTTATPKNVGRSNATSAEQQAILEVEALYTKKIERDGYKEDLNTPDLFVAPMLARDFLKVPRQVPDNIDLYLSPKLDGVRCTWNPVTKQLVSRKGLEYAIPIVQAALKDCELSLDGELYLHGYPLNEIVAATKKPNDLTPMLEYHVFDVISDDQYDLRILAAEMEIKRLGSPYVQLVRSVVRKKSEIRETHDLYVAQGYEGVMIRNPTIGYEIGVRSASLFKMKDFKDAEFPITDVFADKDGGAVLQCHAHGTEFKVRCRGTDAYRTQQLKDKDHLIGKWVTVRYQTMTPFGAPQFPVGVAVRDYE
jgi:DNA ligase-1